MNTFTLIRPGSLADASEALGKGDFALPVLKAGGIDLLDHMKEGLLEPDALIDVRRLGRSGAPAIRRASDGERIEVDGGVTLAQLASDPLVRESAPVLAAASESAATPQVRNAASVAGNLLQRPRCWYYRNEEFDCLKKGGDRCFAAEGENKYHAIFGRGPCYIVHPSNIAPPLCVLDGRVHLIGGDRESLPIEDLFHSPSRGVHTEHTLEPAEVITHLSFKPAPVSGFYAVKERQSFDWPMVFAAVALEMSGSRIDAARVCAGAVAPTPWPMSAVAAALQGVDVDDDSALRAACEAAKRGANPLEHNGYKVDLLAVAVRRAVRVAAGRPAVGEA